MLTLGVASGSLYPVILLAAIATGLTLAWRSGRSRGLPSPAWGLFLGTTLVSGFIGSTLLFLDFQPIAPGEKTILGALIVGATAALLAARALDIEARPALDAISVPTLAAMAVGRVGCFIAGCCAGSETTLPWGVTSPRNGTHVHPVQLYEAAADVALIVWLSRWRKPRRDGEEFFAATFGYIGIRIVTEFFRDGRELIGPLNMVQWSLLAVAAVLTLVALRRLHTAVACSTVLMQASPPAPDVAQGPRTELLIGAALRDGHFDQLVGSELLTDCDGSPYSSPTLARRETSVTEARVGLRQRLRGGQHLTIEGRRISGHDQLKHVSPGPVTTTPVDRVLTRATGASLMSEWAGGMWRIDVVSGRFSQTGRPDQGTTAAAMFRFGGEKHWFVEGAVADKTFFPSLGAFSYAGLGYSVRPGGARASFGIGEGGLISLHVPIQRARFDLSYRSLTMRDDGSGGGETFTVEFTQGIRLGRRAAEKR